jgi:hypothetical protein
MFHRSVKIRPTPEVTFLLQKLIVLSASQEIFHLWWNQKVFLPRLQKLANSPYPEPSKSNACLSTKVSKIRFNNILSSTFRASEWSLPFRLSNQTFIHSLHAVSTRPSLN